MFNSSGNKTDLQNARVVSSNEAQATSEYWGMLEYVETSAKDNRNIEGVFRRIASELLIKLSDVDLTDGSPSVNLADKTKNVKSWNCCSN